MSNIVLKPYMRVRNRRCDVFTVVKNPGKDKCCYPFIGEGYTYTESGYYYADDRPSGLNIVEIVPLTKADMKEGMKFVCRNGETFFWAETKSPKEDGDGFLWNNEFSEDLSYSNPHNYSNPSQWDIVEVYALGECIWKRYEEEKTPQQLAIEQAEEELKQAKAILEKAEANLKQAKTV